MRKFLVIFLTVILLISSAKIVLADSGWQFSVENYNITGTFDYILHYYSSDSSQVISRVSLPQNQNMLILDGMYSYPDGGFVKLRYGCTGSGNKGRGSDSDWTIEGSDELTYYGDMDAYGRQTLFSIDFGKTYIANDWQKISIFVGYGEQKSTNEMKNVVYHLIKGVDVGDRTQADNGSSLDLKLSGLRVGASDDIMITSNLVLNLRLIFSALDMRATGFWNNHDPAWNWVNKGSTIGYTADIGLSYSFNNHLSAGLGYFYNYAKADDCNEVLNGYELAQAVDLKYETKGYKFGINCRF
jgi:opacity protein-like surface antigen